MTSNSRANALGRLVGTWATEATHPAMPGVVVHGSTVIEWLEGQRFLTLRSQTDHPDFPGALSVIGDMESDRVDGAGKVEGNGARLRMHYFDSRGVYRDYEASVSETEWRWWREVAGFSQ